MSLIIKYAKKDYLAKIIDGKFFYEFLPNEVDITTGTAMAGLR